MLKTPLIKTPLRYGLIAGVLGFVLVIGFYYMNRHPFLIPVFFDFRLPLFGIIFFFCLKELRDFYFNGTLFFWQGMIACLVLTSVFAIITSASIGIFSSIEKEFVNDFIRIATDQVKAYPQEDIDRIGREVYDEGLKELQNVNAFFMARRYFVQSFGISFFVSIIISVILRRQPPTN